MMSSDMAAKLKRSLVIHEGNRKFLYVDTLGNQTIGIGYNISLRGLPTAIIDDLYNGDVQSLFNVLSNDFSWFPLLCEDRQVALIDMAFNIGYEGFCKFETMISALEHKDYVAASHAMLNSEWAKQVNSRATSLAHVILTGMYII